MSAATTQDRVPLEVLLPRLYARFRARGETREQAVASACALAADMLACPLREAEDVMRSVLPFGPPPRTDDPPPPPPVVDPSRGKPMSFQFVTATKEGSKARIALTGTAGAGKTWSALSIAQGLDLAGGKLGVIDTDRRSARKYADAFGFEWLGMSTYHPDDLVKATIAAEQQGITTLIVDTGSAFWSGQDGMRDHVDKANSSFEGWRLMRPTERRMMEALFGFAGHVIMTLRTKAEYVVEPNEQGRMQPKRVGTKPDQREGIEHEFDVVLDMADAGEIARVSKTRCPELAGRSFNRPGRDVGEIVQAWLDRDAVGEPLNPHTVARWALDETDRWALKDRYDELAERGQLQAVVYGRDGESLVAVGELVLQRARELQQAEERAAQQQARAAANQ